MQQDHEQNRQSEIGRRSSRDHDEDRGFRSGSREQYEGRGYGEQGRNFGEQGRNFGQEDRNFGERGGRSFRDDDDMFLARERSGGQGRRTRGGRSPYGEERDYPYRGSDYRDYGYGSGGYGGGRRHDPYQDSAAYEGRGYGSDYDFEGRGGFENRGGFDDQGYRGSGMQNRGGYGNREAYESRERGGRWNDEGGVSEWSQRGGPRESYSNIFDNERGEAQDQRFGGRGQIGAGQVVGRSRTDTSRSFRGTGPKGYSRSDESIHEDVCQQLEDADLDPSEVTVNVESGEVRLSGTVDSRWAKRYVEDIVYQIRGVKDVRNELRVESGEQQRSQTEGRGAEDQRGNGRSASLGANSEQQQQQSMSS